MDADSRSCDRTSAASKEGSFGLFTNRSASAIASEMAVRDARAALSSFARRSAVAPLLAARAPRTVPITPKNAGEIARIMSFVVESIAHPQLQSGHYRA
jgi:hypothetical protein